MTEHQAWKIFWFRSHDDWWATVNSNMAVAWGCSSLKAGQAIVMFLSYWIFFAITPNRGNSGQLLAKPVRDWDEPFIWASITVDCLYHREKTDFSCLSSDASVSIQSVIMLVSLVLIPDWSSVIKLAKLKSAVTNILHIPRWASSCLPFASSSSLHWAVDFCWQGSVLNFIFQTTVGVNESQGKPKQIKPHWRVKFSSLK